jgi:hypothetical protein
MLSELHINNRSDNRDAGSFDRTDQIWNWIERTYTKLFAHVLRDALNRVGRAILIWIYWSEPDLRGLRKAREFLDDFDCLSDMGTNTLVILN